MTPNNEGLTSLLVQHVADLEAAMTHIEDEIVPALWQAAETVFSEVADEYGWAGKFEASSEANYWIMPPDWATAPAEEQDFEEDAWFDFVESEEDRCWTDLALFLGVSSESSLVLRFEQQMLGGRKWKAILAGEHETLQAIRDAGFLIEQRLGRIDFPVRLDAVTLAQALEEEAVETAFEPLRRALAAVISAKPQFDRLVEAARKVAYGS